MLITYAKWSCHGEEAQTAAALEAAGCVVLAYAGQLSHLYRNPWRICERRTAFGGRAETGRRLVGVHELPDSTCQVPENAMARRETQSRYGV